MHDDNKTKLFTAIYHTRYPLKTISFTRNLNIYTCEAYGQRDIKHSKKEKKKREASEKNYIICTDSLAEIKSLQQYELERNMLKQIQENIELTVEREIKVNILWILSHSQIAGNENVDKAAKNEIEEQMLKKLQYPEKITNRK